MSQATPSRHELYTPADTSLKFLSQQKIMNIMVNLSKKIAIRHTNQIPLCDKTVLAVHWKGFGTKLRLQEHFHGDHSKTMLNQLILFSVWENRL